MQTAVHQAIAPGIRDARDWSIEVLAQDGKLLYADRQREAVEPASAAKLIVTDASLERFGAQFRFDTLFASENPIRDGALSGDLYLAGSGDPSLTSADLAGGARSLAVSGLRQVDGALVVDPHAIAGSEINAYWNPGDANEAFMSPVSGISLDEDTVTFAISGSAPGQAANVRVVPQSPAVRYTGSVRTDGDDDVIVASTQTPNDFRLAGDIPPGALERFEVPVHGIAHYAGTVATGMLQRSGITLGGAPLVGEVPLGAQILWEHRSAPLTRLLHHMLVVSDNHYAEQLMRSLGDQNGTDPDNRDGIAVERRVLAAQGIATPGLHLVDGSGLAHADRLAAVTLAGILAHFQAQANGNALFDLLPRDGKDGTLKDYIFDAAAGRVRAKTGHLDDASSLAGYVQTRKHGRVTFVFMINGSPGDPDAAIISAVDRIAAR